MSWFSKFVYIFSVSSFLHFSLISGNSKQVTTFLNAKWPETSYLHEAAEYLNEDQSPSTFWSFISLVLNSNLNLYNKGNQATKLKMVYGIAEKFLAPSQMSLFKFSLSLRVNSPKLEAFRQIALNQEIQEMGCENVLDVNGKLSCEVDAIDELLENSSNFSKPQLFDIDHNYFGEVKDNIAILYGDPTSKKFIDFHSKLKQLAENGKLTYIFRPFIKNNSERKLRMSGYGVELQIKSTEYKAQDDTKLQEEIKSANDRPENEDEVEGFVFKTLRQLNPDDLEKLEALRAHLLESAREEAPLKVWQLQHLSMQAAQSIMSTLEEERLSTFIKLSENFPSMARSLIRTKVDEQLKKEILKNQNALMQELNVVPQEAVLYVNGMQYAVDSLEIFTLLEQVKNELRIMDSLHKLGLEKPISKELLYLDVSESKTKYGIDIRDSAIHWLNDIEKDKPYARWPNSLEELRKFAYFGMMLKSIRRNIHNFVIVADATKKNCIQFLKLADSYVKQLAPLRFGVVFVVDPDKKKTGSEDAGIALLSAFNYIVQNRYEEEDANRHGLQFILDLHKNLEGDIKSAADVIEFFKKKFPSEDIEEVFGNDSDFDVGRQLSRIFLDKGSFSTFPQVLINGVPLSEKQLAVDQFEETLLIEAMKNTQVLENALFDGTVSDTHDVIDWFMALPNIMPRINNRILSRKHSKTIDISEFSSETLSSVPSSEFEEFSDSEMTAIVSNTCKYIVSKTESTLRPLSVWVVADFETTSGRGHLLEALKYTHESNAIRVCALSNSPNPGEISKVIEVAQSTLSPVGAKNVLTEILEPKNYGEKSYLDFLGANSDKNAFKSGVENFNVDIFKSLLFFNSKVLGIPSGGATVAANGRVLGAFGVNEAFKEDDYSLLERYFSATIGESLGKILKANPSFETNDMYMRITSVLQAKLQSGKSRNEPKIKSSQHSVVKLPPRDLNKPAFDILAICDPVSTYSSKVGAIVKALYSVLNADISIVLNSVEKLSEMPLKSYYRFVLPTEPELDENGDLNLSPSVIFSGLPGTTIFTQNYHTPQNWLVEPVKSLYDLDNIKLDQVENNVHSEFELGYLLLEGHCFDQSSGNPPRGLQITLGTPKNPVLVDTLVMANLGYFQLKANPGAWILKLRTGRSSQLYTIVSHEGMEESDVTSSEDKTLLMTSFKAHVIKIKVAKNAGMEDLDLLDYEEDTEGGGIWNAISSTFTKTEKDEEDTYINIFSVASGHLYERFLRIMMTSVRKMSSRPVKFWIIKNFLSPTLKDSLEKLAKAFDFEFELVQYQWPRWLHQQTEKQRIIWGYKILFLDVLFPLSVKKIIFVDADQVVRDDIADLHDLDLGGAPYGFVPFCDSRKEMEGFRFWKHGYWSSHLRGRKYHISALFVVDLKKFRRVAAGDRLRGQYQGLSQDPNSLSNLDQDLPNNMIHQVKIKSLPQDWLWCETWCDDESKSTAKIIDVCNNPQTKEAKLTAAQRIIPEWVQYDQEIKEVLTKEYVEVSQSHTEL